MTAPPILLDEHVGRLFERLLRERGYTVEQAKDRFGEQTTDRALLEWCGENGTILVSNNAKDFEPLLDLLLRVNAEESPHGISGRV